MNTRSPIDPDTGEWNDSRTGHFIWTNVNVGEAVSEVMTPLTWSIFQYSFSDLTFIPGYNMVGNLCGRIYANGSVTIALLRLSGRNPREFVDELGGGYGPLEAWAAQSQLNIPARSYLPLLRNLARFAWRHQRALADLETYRAGNARWCRIHQTRLNAIQTPAELADFWEHDLARYGQRGFRIVFSSALRYSELVGQLRRDLTRLCGPDDAQILLSGVSTEQELLASLGLVMGVWKVHRGEWTRADFLEQYGHRGPFEDRLFSPDPPHGTAWLDDLLETCARSAVDVEARLAQRRQEHAAAAERLTQRHPRRAPALLQRLRQAAQAARQREAARSEFMRVNALIAQPCALKAGAMTGLGNDIFFLTYPEVWEWLRGHTLNPGTFLPARKAAYARQRARPAYPPVIRGCFDPLQWLADPHRPTDYYDAQAPRAARPDPSRAILHGVAGSRGEVEGRVRCVARVEDADQLQAGEILVTGQTHVGWTPYFPRLAAIITDVGAPLSHAAIVARELGIPAVVGCRDATTRLKTGDRVRVNGGQGRVEILPAL